MSGDENLVGFLTLLCQLGMLNGQHGEMQKIQKMQLSFPAIEITFNTSSNQSVLKFETSSYEGCI
jgi:hypothetical protein